MAWVLDWLTRITAVAVAAIVVMVWLACSWIDRGRRRRCRAPPPAVPRMAPLDDDAAPRADSADVRGHAHRRRGGGVWGAATNLWRCAQVARLREENAVLREQLAAATREGASAGGGGGTDPRRAAWLAAQLVRVRRQVRRCSVRACAGPPSSSSRRHRRRSSTQHRGFSARSWSCSPTLMRRLRARRGLAAARRRRRPSGCVA
jgi:hypothetical protein